MAIISIIGPKGGIGKTTLSINIAAALAGAQKIKGAKSRVCLIDLDLRLPTISSILDSHPRKTFYDLFETLANKTHQSDTLQTVYRIISSFKSYLDGDLSANSRQLAKSLVLYKTIDTNLFHFFDFEFGNQVYDLFLQREKIESPAHLQTLAPLLLSIDISGIKAHMGHMQENSRPLVEDYVNFIEEYGFSIIGGEVPIMGKKNHRKRINEPVFLQLFLEFLNEVCEKFDHVILDTPAGGVNHISSLMNILDHVILVFDMSNRIAVSGSLDALHSFIDYYEEFLQDFNHDRLTGLDKAYVNRLVAANGHRAVEETLRNKKIGLLFNRCQGNDEISDCLRRMREYLDTLDKYEEYKNRIRIVGMMPQHKIIHITNNRGALFYDKDKELRQRVDMVAQSIHCENSSVPSLSCSDEEILQYLEAKNKSGFVARLGRLAASFS
ncbi:MAG: ParA family protein [Nitrospinae bacterium]|nr:ParA family protein [Nitrospinota bacterium]